MEAHISPPSIYKESISNKLVSKKKDNVGSTQKVSIDDYSLNEISSNTTMTLGNNDSVMDLFPDINLTIDIITSSIVSPKNIVETNLIYKLKETNILPIDIGQSMLTTIKTHISDFYNIENNLKDIIKESLYTKGAYIEAIIPDGAISEIIKNGTEELKSSSIGMEEYKTLLDNVDNVVLGNNTKITKETGQYKTIPGMLEAKLEIDSLLTFTDNIGILNLETLKKTNAKDKMHTKLFVGTEDNNKEKEYSLDTAFRKLKESKLQHIVNVPTTNDNSSIPLVLKLPVESVIPIHVVGNPKEHLGYFVLLNEHGSPITNEESWGQSSDLELSQMVKDTVITKAKKELQKKTSVTPSIPNLDEIYESLIENRLKHTLQNSAELKDISDIQQVKHVYNIMLKRVLKNQKTRILFLPEELVQYYAFDYRSNGTGKSLLEQVSVLASIRAILLFGRLMATIKNSIPNTKVNVKLDDNDPDPVRSKERVIAQILKNKQAELPVGILNIHDLTSWVHKIGYFFEFEHPNLPDIKIDTSDVSRDFKVPEDALEEDIRDRMLMTLGVTPELVESGISSDFATTQLLNNILMAKRLKEKQDILKPKLTSHVHKLSKSDELLKKKLKTHVINNMANIKKQLKEITEEEFEDNYIVNYVITDFINSVSIGLPAIEVSSDEIVRDSFTAYKDALETALDSVLSDEAIPPDLSERLGDNIDSYRTVVFHTLLRKWMRDNDYMSELTNIVELDANGDVEFNLMAENEDFVKKVILGLKPILKNNKKLKKLIGKVYDKYESEEEEEPEVEETSTEEPPEPGSEEEPEEEIE